MTPQPSKRYTPPKAKPARAPVQVVGKRRRRVKRPPVPVDPGLHVPTKPTVPMLRRTQGR